MEDTKLDIRAKLDQLVFDAIELERRIERLDTQDLQVETKTTELRQAIEFAQDSIKRFIK